MRQTVPAFAADRAGNVNTSVAEARAATTSAIALSHLPVGAQNGSYMFGIGPILPTSTYR